MAFIKTADSTFQLAATGPERIVEASELENNADLDIHAKIKVFAQNLKVIAPQAKDFLYFTCVMMHAAEAVLYDENGHIKNGSSGQPLEASWEETANGGLKWACNDPNVFPYKNSNGDIFPEMELKKAYKDWVGKPLCLDHKSSSMDFVRGVLVDTVYDDKRKRVIALCALDKKNYPDLADKVSSGVANNVSMGTAVGRAVCTESGCHRVARTASDFCHHMSQKSAYGEINLDLSPIELSIVVSGADQKAKIKHIVASDLKGAAQSLEDYLAGKIALGGISNSELVGIQRELQALTNKVNKLATSEETSEDQNDTNYGTTGSQKSMGETVSDSPNENIQPGVESWPSYASDLQRDILGTQVKLAALQDSVDKISLKNGSEEKTMSTIDKNAYMQGTVEPNAGGVTYQPEPGNERARMEAKHMLGPSPFPGVGDINGSYPGDTELKKSLQREASQEEAHLMRQALLDRAKAQLKSNAYMQGTEEPTNYKPDPEEGKARMQDKQMVGAKPFPGVGNINGLYGDDMKVKEMLARASLNAKFRKVSTIDGLVDKQASRWDVYANGKLIVSTTVGQITRGNADALYDSVATENFGKSLIAGLRSDYKATLSKFAQQPPAAPAPAAAPAAPAAAAPAAPADPEMDLEMDPEGGGDQLGELVKELDALLGDMGNVVSDIKDAAGVVDGDAEAVEGVEPAGEEAFSELPPEGMKTAKLQSMRATLHGMLRSGLRETHADLRAHAKEIGYVRKLYTNKYASMDKEQRRYLNSLAASSVTDARSTLGEGVKMIAAFVDYAQGTVGMLKKAQIESTPIPPPGKGSPLFGDPGAEEVSAADDLDFMDDMSFMDDEFGDTAMANDKKNKNKEEEKEEEEEEEEECDEDGDDADDVTLKLNPNALDDAKVVTASDLSTKEGRAMSRVKLAQKGLEFSDMLNKAHPSGSEEVPNLDIKPTDPMAKFHVLKDTHDAMMQLANLPPKVRKQAANIAKLIEAGDIAYSDLDTLVSHNVDPMAVKYYKQYWGEAKDSQSSDYASKLTQEHANQKKAEEQKAYQIRVKRAYQLASGMVRVGWSEESRIDEQVEEIMGWNDAGFESMAKQVNRQKTVKKASMPTVGLLHSGDVIMPSFESNASSQDKNSDVRSFFDSYFGNAKLGKF